MVPFFQKNTTWIVGTARRLDSIKHYVLDTKSNYDYLCFLDMDCYVTEDFEEVFYPLKELYDIGLTRLISQEDKVTAKTATAGVFFAKNNDQFRNFVFEWVSLSNKYKRNSKMTRDHKISFVQYSFTELVKASFHGLKKYKMINYSEKIYNSERQDLQNWYKDIKKYNPKILHYKGNRFQDRNIVTSVQRIYKDILSKITAKRKFNGSL